MTTIVTRAGKGSALTHNEVDSNFTNLNSAKYESGNNATLGTIQGSTITATTAFSGALNGTVGATTPAAGTFTSLSDSGNLTFTSTGNRITGDFSNATLANRVAFQTNLTNGSTTILAIPNGTGSTSQLLLRSSSSVTNDSFGQAALVGGTDFRIASGATGTGTYLPMTFYTGGSEAMRIGTSGNVAIGTTNPTTGGRLVVNNSASASAPSLDLLNNGNYNAQLGLGVLTGFGDTVGINARQATGLVVFGTNNEERMRISSGGNLLVGGTAVLNGSRQTIYASAGVITVGRNTNTTAGKFWSIPYIDTNNTLYILNQNNFGVYLSDGATSWTANSDERLKDIIEPITDATNKISKLRAVIGKYKTDEENTRRTFLIAQDVQAVLPEAVDATNPDKLGVQYTDVIPLLVASIKELKAELDTIKAELTALKGAA